MGKENVASLRRCGWCGSDPLYRDYHDTEWGVPLYDPQQLFEFLLLEGAQAGLSWITVLRKREYYRRVYNGFNPEKIARYNRRKIEALLRDPGIIRNRLKVESAVKNARAFLSLQEAGTDFTEFLWDFVGGEPVQNRWDSLKAMPVSTPVSDAMSKALKKAGFNFVGSTICYAFMQATGMVNDHLQSCYRYRECAELGNA